MHIDAVTLGSTADIHSLQDCVFIFEYFFYMCFVSAAFWRIKSF